MPAPPRAIGLAIRGGAVAVETTVRHVDCHGPLGDRVMHSAPVYFEWPTPSHGLVADVITLARAALGSARSVEIVGIRCWTQCVWGQGEQCTLDVYARDYSSAVPAVWTLEQLGELARNDLRWLSVARANRLSAERSSEVSRAARLRGEW